MTSVEPGGRLPVELTINGARRAYAVEPRWLLSDVLRRVAGLTGTHVGCEHGVCGACTVLLDGRPVRSCLTLAVSVAGHEITTVEGLVEKPEFGRLLEEFSRAGALQCGFCTPGMVMACAPLLSRREPLSEADVRRELTGHLCRCTGYVGIVDAVRAVVNRHGERPR
jgi:carbon-monoxide dehydrogenase small subunit